MNEYIQNTCTSSQGLSLINILPLSKVPKSLDTLYLQEHRRKMKTGEEEILHQSSITPES